MKDSERIVYSTDSGRICKSCQRPTGSCTCKEDDEKPTESGAVKIQRESKGRKGKTVTVITGLPLSKSQLKVLEKELKARCGCGGTTKDGAIEIQGDHSELLLKELNSRGYSAKLAGG